MDIIIKTDEKTLQKLLQNHRGILAESLALNKYKLSGVTKSININEIEGITEVAYSPMSTSPVREEIPPLAHFKEKIMHLTDYQIQKLKLKFSDISLKKIGQIGENKYKVLSGVDGGETGVQKFLNSKEYEEPAKSPLTTAQENDPKTEFAKTTELWIEQLKGLLNLKQNDLVAAEGRIADKLADMVKTCRDELDKKITTLSEEKATLQTQYQEQLSKNTSLEARVAVLEAIFNSISNAAKIPEKK